MTYSVLGIDTNQVKEIDPRTGREKVFYLPKINQQTGKEERIRLAQAARRQGTYLIGATGTGKSAVILNLVMQDIKQGKGIAVLDPHSDLINSILARLDEDDIERVVLLDPLDETHVFGLNLYSCADPTHDVLVQGTYEQVEHIFDVLWLDEGEDQFGPQVREGLLYSSYALIYNSGTEYTGCGMLEIPLLFQEGTPRANMVKHIQDPVIRSYWENKYEPFDRYEKARRADMVINKLNEFIANPIFRRIVGQGTTTVDFHDVMDNGKILLVKLPGRFERMAQILGAMVIAQLLGASYEREKQHKRPQFNIYADEFQRFATRDFAKLLTEASRKYNTPVTIAHQARDFIDLRNKAATLQVPNLIVLRIIRKDADEIAGNFDCTPIRTKRVLKRRTKPIFNEWDEYVWDSDKAERYYNEELAERIAEAERSIPEAAKRAEQAIYRFLCAEALVEHFRSAFSRSWYPYDGSSYGDNAHYFKYPHSPLNPFWLLPDGTLRTTHYSLKQDLGWTEGDLNAVGRNLVLRDMKSETIHDHFYYWPGWWQGKCRSWDRKRVDYSYLKREEWYSLTQEAAISGVEYVLRYGSWPIVITKGFSLRQNTSYTISRKQEVDALFRTLLEEFIAEVHAYTTAIYERSLLKFYPALAPEMPWDRAKRDDPYCSEGWSPPEDGKVVYRTLASCKPPEIGGRWSIGWDYPGHWMECGRWEPLIFTGAESWLARMEQRLEAQVKEREKELKQRQQELEQYKQKVKALTQQQEAYKQEHYKPIHHKDYLGEQPEVDKQERISHSYSSGSSHSISHSRMGGESFGTSSSKSTSYSTADVQWYDLEDELDQTPDQRRDEIAGEIAMLPDYVARVRIKDENDEFVEYTIRTLKPEEGLRGQALNERIARIKETMIGNKIIRPKHVIDEEIRKRQEALRRPQLEPPHKQGKLPPPEDEPPITRRG